MVYESKNRSAVTFQLCRWSSGRSFALAVACSVARPIEQSRSRRTFTRLSFGCGSATSKHQAVHRLVSSLANWQCEVDFHFVLIYTLEKEMSREIFQA
jgi:hypothetical protein